MRGMQLHGARVAVEGETVTVEVSQVTIDGYRRMLAAPVTGRYPSTVPVAVMLGEIEAAARGMLRAESQTRPFRPPPVRERGATTDTADSDGEAPHGHSEAAGPD